MTTQMQTRPMQISETSQDPRIDSPEVKVIYPTPEVEPQTEPLKEQPQQPAQSQEIRQDQPQPEKTEEHTCKVDLQQAIKQNLVAFILLLLVALGIGYLIGKK